MRSVRIAVFAVVSLITSVSAVATEPVPLKNWPVAFQTLLDDRRVEAARPFRFEVNAVPSAASHFVAVVPCRVLDTRNSGSPLPANSTVTVNVPGAACGVPSGGAAYSLNLTAMNPADNGYLTAYPTGSVQPATATLSYLAGGPVFDNAAIVPAGTGGSIDVYVAASLHLIIDINGYFVEGVVTSVTTSDGLSGGGTSNVTLGVANGGIADAKLATITTPGKVANSATTATSANTLNTIVARNQSGGFAAGALTLSGKLSHTSVDGLLSSGSLGSGTIPAAGSGTRLMWYPRQSAFRAGTAVGSEWDDPSVGQNSVALGRDVTASGVASLALGQTTSATANYTLAVGYDAHATSLGAKALCYMCEAGGMYSLATNVRTVASGHYSVAMGYFASTTDAGGTPRDGTFVWSDASTSAYIVRPTAANQFVTRAVGGTMFYTNGLSTTGVMLQPGGGSWGSISSRERKKNFEAVDGEMILDRLAALPVTSWQYRDDEAGRRYIGPVAEDFFAAFDLGDDKTITTLDVDGVTLAAIKALEQRTAKIDHLETENEALRAQIERLSRAVEQLQAGRSESLRVNSSATPP